MATHYLRDKRNKSFFEVETDERDIHPSVYTEEYSRVLLYLWWWKRKEFVADTSALQDIRSAWWVLGNTFKRAQTSPHIFVREAMLPIADKWDLLYIED